MKRPFFVLGYIGFLFFVCFGGCDGGNQNQVTSSNSAPVVITLIWDCNLGPGQCPKLSICGELMTSASTTISKSSKVRMISGTIDGISAEGFALHRGQLRSHPVFEVLSTTPEGHEGREILLEGQSSVEWRLVVEGGSGILLQHSSGKTMESGALLSPGLFKIRVWERQ